MSLGCNLVDKMHEHSPCSIPLFPLLSAPSLDTPTPEYILLLTANPVACSTIWTAGANC